ncbi:MAG: hypothetical protein QXS37_04955 [Candidatus Aenigmatarchaeota archaeon]
MYLLRAYEIAENYNHTLKDYFKKIEELEGIDVEKKIRIPKFKPPKIFVRTHKKLLAKLKKWLQTYPEDQRCKDFIMDLFEYREGGKYPWMISMNEVKNLAANHYVSWKKTHKIMLDLQEKIRRRDGFLGWPTDTIIVSLGNLARLLGLSAQKIYEEAQKEYVEAKEKYEQKLREYIKSLPRLRID